MYILVCFPESMLAMHLRVGPQLSFAASCAPIEALRGDYDQGFIRRRLGDSNFSCKTDTKPPLHFFL